MSSGAESLEQVLTDERGDAAILRRNGHGHDADLIERVCDRVSKAAEEYLRFLAEPDARLRTNRSQEYLRARYPEWETQGHAYKRAGVRYYRMLVLPPRANLSASREEGRRAGAA